MELYKLGEMEEKFAHLIWEQAPVPIKVLIQLCEVEFAWKRTTTYTMLKRLCDRGIFKNTNGVVEALMTKEMFMGARGEAFVEESFQGSLPKFLTAFTARKKLNAKEIAAIRELLQNYEEENKC